MDFVAQYLKSTNPEVRDEAAFALGASRIPGALDVLIETWKETKNREFGGVLLRALSSSRQSKAIDFLLKVVRTGTSRDTALALDALKLHEQSPEIQTLVEQAKKEKEKS
jgi:ERCC4-type nuclease